MKRWLQRIALMAVSLLIALLGAELVVRLTLYVPRGTPYVAEDPDTIYFNKPHILGRHDSPGEFSYQFKTGSKGFRSGEHGPRNSHVPRILCLGDSFTFGIGVDDLNTWPAQLETGLLASGKRPEVVNAGVMGWGLAEYWIWTSLHALEIQPSLIIVACHAGDWENASNGLTSLESDGTLKRHQVVRKDISRLKKVTAQIPLYDTLMTHSAIANLIKQAVIRVTNAGTTGGAIMSAENVRDLAARETALFEKLTPVNRALLRGLQQTAADAGAGLLIAFIPSYGEITPGGKPGAGQKRFRQDLTAWTQELGISFVDTTPMLKLHLDKHALPVEALYFPKNEHCTTVGYQVIAKGISEEIARHPEWLASPVNQPSAGF